MPLRVGSHAVKKDLGYVMPEWFTTWNATDNTAAIQEAIVYASANNKNVKFQKKTYFVTSTLRLYKNVALIGEYGTIIRRTGTQTRMFANGEIGNTTYASGYNGDGNINVKRVQFDLNATNVAQNNGISCVDLGHSENVLFSECTFENGKNGHFVQIAGCKKVYFEKCTFKNQILDVSDSKRDFEAVQAEVITATSFPAFGSYDNTPSIDIRLIDCHFENVIRGFGTHTTIDADSDGTPDIYNEDVSIINCTFKNVIENAIHSVAYRDIKLLDNRIDTCKNGIYVLNSERTLTRNNFVENAQETGMYTSNSNVTSENDCIKDCSQSGSYAAFRFNNSNVVIDNPIVDYTTTAQYTFGIYATTSDLTINQDKRVRTGKNGRISCASGEESRVFGSRIVTLWEGQLDVVGTIITLPEKLNNFSMLVVCGNDNTNATATMTSAVIPLPLLNFGASTSRFRLVTDSNSSSGQTLNDRLGFSFPTTNQIRLDEKQGDGAIRKIYAYI